jgi:hypothetical protein
LILSYKKNRESVQIGTTDFTKDEIEQIVVQIGRDFRGIDYHLMNKNCNNFSSQFAKTICGQDIPPWVNRLAYLTTFIPFVEKMIPREWISPIAVQHTVESHMNEIPSSNDRSSQQASYSLFSSSTTSSSQQRNNLNNNQHKQNNNERSDGSIWSSIFSNLERLEQNENIQNSNKTV